MLKTRSKVVVYYSFIQVFNHTSRPPEWCRPRENFSTLCTVHFKASYNYLGFRIKEKLNKNRRFFFFLKSRVVAQYRLHSLLRSRYPECAHQGNFIIMQVFNFDLLFQDCKWSSPVRCRYTEWCTSKA